MPPKPDSALLWEQPRPAPRINEYWLTKPEPQPKPVKTDRRKTKGIPSAAIVPAGETNTGDNHK
jgi:hypothetical protein